MSDFRPKELILQARSSVGDASYSPKKLTLLHTGIAAGLSLVLSLLTYFLDVGIGNTSGLSGLDSRAALETAQSVLQLIVFVFSPFWALGFVAAGLRWSRRQDAVPATLCKGLRRWGPAVRMFLLETLIYFVVVFVAVEVGSVLYSLTPASSALQDLIAGAQTDDLSDILAQMDNAAYAEIFLGMLPFILIPMLIAIVPVFYRLRFASYILMDDPRRGALYAVVTSWRLTKHNCLKLLRIDIRYWWYYLLEAAVLVLSAGDMLASLVGLELNMSAMTASIVFYVLALGAQLALYAWKKPQLFASYALLYDRLRPVEQENV